MNFDEIAMRARWLLDTPGVRLEAVHMANDAFELLAEVRRLKALLPDERERGHLAHLRSWLDSVEDNSYWDDARAALDCLLDRLAASHSEGSGT